MSGSGNDFVFIDARQEPAGRMTDPIVVESVCRRGSGVGADGIVFLESSSIATLRMTYLNSDGSRAAMCGNAALCSTRLAVELGAADSAAEFTLETDSGVIGVRMRGGAPEVDMAPVRDVRPQLDVPLDAASGEQEIGFALVGVPHLVILCEDVDAIDVVGRGRPLRGLHSLTDGANVNFVSADRAGGAWRMRTYERGVEAETLACGTGAVSSAILLSEWGRAGDRIELRTRSDLPLLVSVGRESGFWRARLSGEARVVFVGRLAEI